MKCFQAEHFSGTRIQCPQVDGHHGCLTCANQQQEGGAGSPCTRIRRRGGRPGRRSGSDGWCCFSRCCGSAAWSPRDCTPPPCSSPRHTSLCAMSRQTPCNDHRSPQTGTARQEHPESSPCSPDGHRENKLTLLSWYCVTGLRWDCTAQIRFSHWQDTLSTKLLTGNHLLPL